MGAEEVEKLERAIQPLVRNEQYVLCQVNF
jgi:hypothetical protein